MDIAELKKKFPNGSTVLLRSGGPAMTVEWMRDDGVIPVVWFDGTEVQRDAFDHEALIAVP